LDTIVEYLSLLWFYVMYLLRRENRLLKLISSSLVHFTDQNMKMSVDLETFCWLLRFFKVEVTLCYFWK